MIHNYKYCKNVLIFCLNTMYKKFISLVKMHFGKMKIKMLQTVLQSNLLFKIDQCTNLKNCHGKTMYRLQVI